MSLQGYLKTGRWNECQDMIKEFEKNNVDLSAHRWVLLCILALASHNSGDNNLAFDHLESGRKALSKSLSKDELGFLMVLSSFLGGKTLGIQIHVEETRELSPDPGRTMSFTFYPRGPKLAWLTIWLLKSIFP
jgi:hypothetical protein